MFLKLLEERRGGWPAVLLLLEDRLGFGLIMTLSVRLLERLRLSFVFSKMWRKQVYVIERSVSVW